MVKVLPQRFNPNLLARDGTRYELVLPHGQLPRLADILSSAENNVQVTARFSHRKDYIVINGRLETQFALVCQRCLKPFEMEISEAFELVFVDDEQKAHNLPKELDPVVLDDGGQIHVVDLFEDEVILHVPDIPRHNDLKACKLGQTEYGDLPTDVKKEKPNPFDTLKNLHLH